MKFLLFGQELTLPFAGSIGGFTNHADASLSGDGNTLSLKFEGDLPGGRALFQGVFPCRVDGETVQLLPSAQPPLGQEVKVQLPLGLSGWSLPNPALLTGPGFERLGVGFSDSDRQLRAALKGIQIGDSLKTLDWAENQEWARHRFSFDLAVKSTVFFPSSGGALRELQITDKFFNIFGQTGPKREQNLALEGVEASADRIVLLASPTDKFLSVHPDILDTRGALSPGNDILFQHVLVNGELEILLEGLQGRQHAFTWRRRQGSIDQGPAGMLAFRLADEHGHPLLIESDRFPLTHREGVAAENVATSSANAWEQTLPAIVIDSSQPPIKLRSIDPASVDLDSADPERKWLQNGRVKPGGVPREIHGLAKGTFLEWTGPATAEHVDGTLHTSHVDVQDLGRLFTKTELAFGDISQWRLNTQLEERDVYPEVAEKPGVSTIGMRRAEPKAGASLRVPLIDTSYALANLSDETGKVLHGHILADTIPWLHELDQQFAHPTNAVFDVKPVDNQTHVSGFEVAPLAVQPFQSVLDLPPGRANSAAETARTGVALVSTAVDFIHGGDRVEATRTSLRTALEGSASFSDGLLAFQKLWYSRTSTPAEAELRARLREILGEARPKSGVLDAELGVILKAAQEVLYGSRTLETFVDTEIAQLRPLIPPGISPGTFRNLWETATAPLTVAFLDALWSPAGPALYSRAQQSGLIPRPAAGGDLLSGFLSPTVQGMDPIFVAVADLWRTAASLEALRRKYGFAFTGDVYRRLLKPEADADLRRLFAEFKAARPDLMGTLLDVEAGLDFLRRMPSEPPEYIFFTRRFRLERTQKPDDLWDRLWNHQFPLCGVAEQKAWKFVLDGDSSVIVKLTGQRSIDDILGEIEASYQSSGRQNPLGFPKDLPQFLSDLDLEIRRPSWRGVLIVRPTADIGEDIQLANLAGLSQLPIVYVALGGAKPDLLDDKLDVYARIFQEKEAQPADKAALGDTGLTLIKFDATIRNTRLVAGEVALQLDIRNLWGREDGQFKEILVRGTLPRQREGDTGGSSFEFAAWLPEPAELKVNLAFVKSFVFRAMRVATNKGRTSIEIDGDVLLQKWDGLSLEGLGSGFSIDLGEMVDRIGLQGFRILLPSLEGGGGLRMGLARLLNFEFPALSFNLPRPRVLNLWGGIELKPFGMGFLRRIGEAAAELQPLLDRYQWLHGFKTDGIFTFPYLRCEIDFGKLPRFGGTGLSRLKLEMLIGLVFRGVGQLPEIAIGLGGLDMSELSIDLFGVVKLEIEKLFLGLFEMNDHRKAAAIYVRNPRLSILGWSPLPDSAQLQLLMAQSTDLKDAEGRAVLGWYADANKNDHFFQIYWLLLAHNLGLDRGILDHLLGSKFDSNAPKLLDGLVDTTSKKIAAQILNDDSWLFGASFRLGDIVEQGTFVLHDQHYYGISLRGPIVQTLFGTPFLELAYIPGPTRELDRFRTNLRLPALDLLGPMQSGEVGLEWGFNWDFLLDFGFPWKQGSAYLWERAFTVPLGTYEAKFGLYFEKRHQLAPAGTQSLVLGAGAGFYLGYAVGFGTPGKGVWARAGIGIFGILEGRIVFSPAGGDNPLKGSIQEVDVRGVLGIWAYGDGGIEVWVLSARFRVSVQAAIAGELHYLPHANSTFAYEATLSAGYSASCRIGSGFFSFTFEVSGHFEMHVSGQLLLN